jgi:hypothetical protein
MKKWGREETKGIGSVFKRLLDPDAHSKISFGSGSRWSKINWKLAEKQNQWTVTVPVIHHTM